MTEAEVRHQFNAARVMKMMVRAGYDMNEVHPDAYRKFSWAIFVDELVCEVAAVALTHADSNEIEKTEGGA